MEYNRKSPPFFNVRKNRLKKIIFDPSKYTVTPWQSRNYVIFIHRVSHRRVAFNFSKKTRISILFEDAMLENIAINGFYRRKIDRRDEVGVGK